MDDPVAVGWIELGEITTAPGLVSSNQARSAAAEEVEHNRIPPRNVLDGVDQLDGLYGRVDRQLVQSPGTERVNSLSFKPPLARCED